MSTAFRRRIVLCALIVLSVAVVPSTAQTNRIVLRVNDDIVTLYDYQLRYADQRRQLMAAPISESDRTERLAGLGEAVLREMFDELLLLSRASQQGLEVTEAMIEESIQAMREANGLDDGPAFDAALAQVGLNRSKLRTQVRQNLLLQQVMAQEMQERVELNEEDLRRYYQSHLEEFSIPRRIRVSSIVVLDTSALSQAERDALAGEARQVLAIGEGAETWAKSKSDLQQTTTLVNLGWVGRGDLQESLEGAVWDLEVGGVGGPVEGRGGMHVLRVDDVQEATVRPFNEVQDEVQSLEMSRLQREAVTKMLADFEKASFIRIDPPPEAAGFRSSRAADDSALGGDLGSLESTPEG